MSHNVPWKSPAVQLNPGTNVDFADFVPLLGPNGGRVVVDYFEVCINGTITVGTGAWDGRDVPRLVQLVTVEKRDGRLRHALSGFKSRKAAIYFGGIDRYTEHGNVAVGAAQAIDLRLPLWMKKRFVARPEDFSLPADVFKKISVTFAALANAQTGTAALSANALTCYILAHWHEEMKVEFKCDDIIKSTDFNSNTQAKLALVGAVQDAYIDREDTTAGGAVITAITDVRCEDLGTPLLTRQDLVNRYTTSRLIAPTGPTTPATERFLDPVREGKLLPFFVSDEQTSPWDGKVLDSMKIDVGAGATSLSMVTREVVDKSQTDINQLMARHGVKPSDIVMETKKGNKMSIRDPHWSKRQLVVGAWSAPLKRAA
jgi:hypothetical protein